jgi:hypothetical protein
MALHDKRDTESCAPIKNVVVVMFENRSYDNVLGWLYNASNQPPYQTAPPGQADLDGLTGNESNPDPNHQGQTISVANQTALIRSSTSAGFWGRAAFPQGGRRVPLWGKLAASEGDAGIAGGNVDNKVFNRSSISARAQGENLGAGRGAPGTRAGDSPGGSRC